MKRRILALFSLSAVLLLFGAAPAAKADVYVEPTDHFHEEHQAECTRIDRVFIANGSGGSVSFYANPESETPLTSAENGSVIPIAFSYTDADGVEWLYGSIKRISPENYGWCRAGDVYVRFDSLEFQQQYPVREETGVIDGLKPATTVCYWDYPGGRIIDRIYYDPEYELAYDLTFTDEEGRLWVRHPAVYQDGYWICLDEPGAAEQDLYPNGMPVRDKRDHSIPEVPEPAADTPESGNPAFDRTAVILAAVAATVLISALLLLRMRRRRSDPPAQA